MARFSVVNSITTRRCVWVVANVSFSLMLVGGCDLGVEPPSTNPTTAPAETGKYLATLRDGLRTPGGTAVDADGIVLVADPFYGHLARFDTAGHSLRPWPIPGTPLGVAAHPDRQRILVSLRDKPKVAIFIRDRWADTLGFTAYLGEGAVTFRQPTALAVMPSSGDIYVVDSGGDCVYRFSSDGALLGQFGGRGIDDGRFRRPSGIAIEAAEQLVFIADQDNFRIQVFDPAGSFQRSFGSRLERRKTDVQASMPRPQGLAVASDGRLYVADSLLGTVTMFDPAGENLGTIIGYGFGPGSLRTPSGIAFNGDASLLYVCNTNSSSVEVFSAPFDLPGPVHETTPAGPILADGAPGPRQGPHFSSGVSSCQRCHDLTGQPGDDDSTIEGQAMLCMSCHNAGGQALGSPIHEQDVANPYGANLAVPPGRGRSHAWGVPAVSAAAESVGPQSGGLMEQYLKDGNIKCTTCHNPHGNPIESPYLRVSNQGDAMCKECHTSRDRGPGSRGTHPVGFSYPGGVGEYPAAADVAPAYIKSGRVECLSCHSPHNADSGGANGGAGDGMLLRAAPNDSFCRTCHAEHQNHNVRGSWQPGCLDCHAIHDTSSQNLALISRKINGQDIVFQNDLWPADTAQDFVHSDRRPATYDGVCEVCHTQTAYYRNSPGGDHTHFHDSPLSCTHCHTHRDGFKVRCLGCHD